MAVKLKISINLIDKTLVTVANNNTIESYGRAENIPIKINNEIYHCNAIVLKDTAQELLLGNNFLSKLNCIIDIEQMVIKIPKNDKIYDVIQCSASKISYSNLKNYTSRRKNTINCYATEKTTISPNHTKYININPTSQLKD